MSGGRLVAAGAAIGLIWWATHGSSASNRTTQTETASGFDANSSATGGDLTDTDADTSGIKGGETYDEYNTRRDQVGDEPGAFGGFGCTQDCSGHEAGYQWAQDHGITDESDCGGNSWSFQEGCVAYAQEQSGDDDVTTSSDDEDDDATTSSDDDDDPPQSFGDFT